MMLVSGETKELTKMGNAESQPESPILPSVIKEDTVTSPVRIAPQPISKRGAIVSGSPVAGSPLALFEQGSIGSTSWIGKARLSYERNNVLGSSPGFNLDYIQPVGERNYKNSAKIVHGYSTLGLAPIPQGDTKEKTIPIMIVWSHPGKVVHLTGTFNNWKKKIRLHKSNEDFSTIVDMPIGTHQFKFIVDEEWKCSEDLPISHDIEGNLVNCLDVTDEDGNTLLDGLENIADDFGYERGINLLN